jgi:hypothetical protein
MLFFLSGTLAQHVDLVCTAQTLKQRDLEGKRDVPAWVRRRPCRA